MFSSCQQRTFSHVKPTSPHITSSVLALLKAVCGGWWVIPSLMWWKIFSVWDEGMSKHKEWHTYVQCIDACTQTSHIKVQAECGGMHLCLLRHFFYSKLRNKTSASSQCILHSIPATAPPRVMLHPSLFWPPSWTLIRKDVRSMMSSTFGWLLPFYTFFNSPTFSCHLPLVKQQRLKCGKEMWFGSI